MPFTNPLALLSCRGCLGKDSTSPNKTRRNSQGKWMHAFSDRGDSFAGSGDKLESCEGRRERADPSPAASCLARGWEGKLPEKPLSACCYSKFVESRPHKGSATRFLVIGWWEGQHLLSWEGICILWEFFLFMSVSSIVASSRWPNVSRGNSICKSGKLSLSWNGHICTHYFMIWILKPFKKP